MGKSSQDFKSFKSPHKNAEDEVDDDNDDDDDNNEETLDLVRGRVVITRSCVRSDTLIYVPKKVQERWIGVPWILDNMICVAREMRNLVKVPVESNLQAKKPRKLNGPPIQDTQNKQLHPLNCSGLKNVFGTFYLTIPEGPREKGQEALPSLPLETSMQ
ncbi:hypothetical protein Ahy_B05g078196 [Arachis hypogaea]|uniref:Uncharacterized protein n=1 Tax=Arachis hypogaea TaxID=3818 RepID=A0A444Z6J4_ARAHY|nr:hypothetical protein Ahy_B05g078196 [Arachis hypogaea]